MPGRTNGKTLKGSTLVHSTESPKKVNGKKVPAQRSEPVMDQISVESILDGLKRSAARTRLAEWYAALPSGYGPFMSGDAAEGAQVTGMTASKFLHDLAETNPDQIIREKPHSFWTFRKPFPVATTPIVKEPVDELDGLDPATLEFMARTTPVDGKYHRLTDIPTGVLVDLRVQKLMDGSFVIFAMRQAKGKLP